MVNMREPCTTSHPVDAMEPELNPDDTVNVDAQTLAMLSEALANVLRWASQARTVNQMAMRMWVMLYVMRPALIEAVSMDTIGAETSCSRQRIHVLIDQFRRVFCVTNHLEKECNPRSKSTD